MTESAVHEGVAEDVVYAGFWTRAIATVVDAVLFGVFQGALFFAAYRAGLFELQAVAARPFYVLLSQAIPAAIAVVFWVNWSATPGKMLVGARVADAHTGGRPTLQQCLERYFAYYISWLPLCLGFLWVIWDRHKQGWHDKLAGTVVVRRASGEANVVRFDAA